MFAIIYSPKDIIKKLDLYMSCSIEEYWIVNPMNNSDPTIGLL